MIVAAFEDSLYLHRDGEIRELRQQFVDSLRVGVYRGHPRVEREVARGHQRRRFR